MSDHVPIKITFWETLSAIRATLQVALAQEDPERMRTAVAMVSVALDDMIETWKDH